MPAFKTELNPAIFQLKNLLTASKYKEDKYKDLAGYLRQAYPQMSLEEIYKTLMKRRIEKEQADFKTGSAFGRNNLQTDFENNLGLENIYRLNQPTSDRLWM